MALTMFPGGINKEPQDRIHLVVQGNEGQIEELNEMLKHGWRISEIISLSGFDRLPGEAHYLLTKGELL
jgi:hypothetical protein